MSHSSASARLVTRINQIRMLPLRSLLTPNRGATIDVKLPLAPTLLSKSEKKTCHTSTSRTRTMTTPRYGTSPILRQVPWAASIPPNRPSSSSTPSSLTPHGYPHSSRIRVSRRRTILLRLTRVMPVRLRPGSTRNKIVGRTPRTSRLRMRSVTRLSCSLTSLPPTPSFQREMEK
jgi:hypothetical protein